MPTSEDWSTWVCSVCGIAIRPVDHQRDRAEPTTFYHPGGGMKGDHHGGEWEAVRQSSEGKRWTMRYEGYHEVRIDPPLEPDDEIEVVPASEVERLREALTEVRRCARQEQHGIAWNQADEVLSDLSWKYVRENLKYMVNVADAALADEGPS